MNLVLVPGIRSDRRAWAPLAAALAGRFVVQDVDTTQDDTIEAMAQRALAAVGGEMGPAEMGRLAGDRVRGMVLSNGACGAAMAGRGGKSAGAH